MRRFFEIAFAVVTTLLATAVVLQLYLAGVGVFSDPTDRLFAVHGWNGRIVLPLLVLLTILFAVLAKAGRRTVWMSVIVLGLLVLQSLIFVITGLVFNIGPETPPPAARGDAAAEPASHQRARDPRPLRRAGVPGVVARAPRVALDGGGTGRPRGRRSRVGGG